MGCSQIKAKSVEEPTTTKAADTEQAAEPTLLGAKPQDEQLVKGSGQLLDTTTAPANDVPNLVEEAATNDDGQVAASQNTPVCVADPSVDHATCDQKQTPDAAASRQVENSGALAGLQDERRGEVNAVVGSAQESKGEDDKAINKDIQSHALGDAADEEQIDDSRQQAVPVAQVSVRAAPSPADLCGEGGCLKCCPSATAA